ncbi:MAG TPA: hypothetical protein VFD30_20345 [Terriglobia bacterium]|nr:hypothetical protein [Terriglobia bacterium]
MISYRYFVPWSPYSRFRAGRYGKMDGKQGIPPVDSRAFSDYEMEIKNLADENMDGLARLWADDDRRLKADYCNAKSELAAARAEVNCARGALRTAQGKFDPVAQEMNQHYGAILLNPLLYWLLILIIVGGEFPLNSIVFRVMGESTVATYIFSTAIAFGLPAAAHLLGLFLRKRPFAQGIGNTEAVLTILCIVLPVVGILSVAYLREKYFESREIESILSVKLDPTAVTLVFIGINLLVFALAAFASYLAHDPVISNCRKRLRLATRELNEAQRQLQAAQQRVERAEKRLDGAKAHREASFQATINRGREIQDFTQRLIAAYRASNLRARNNPQTPGIWGKGYPEISFRPPLNTGKLDRSCPSEEAAATAEAGSGSEAATHAEGGS